MSGWSTISIELVDSDEYHQFFDSFVREDVQEALEQFIAERGGKVFSGCSMTTSVAADGPHMCLLAQRRGYRDWVADADLIEALSTYTTGRAVVVQANDTSDLGTAKYFVLEDGHAVCKDTFAETEDESIGIPVFELAD